MSLSTEAKKQIEKEERERLEKERYRDDVRSKLGDNPKRKSIGCLTWVFIFFILILLGTVTKSFSNSSVGTGNLENLSGDVKYNNFTFGITNTENRDWNNCHLTLNSNYHYPGPAFSDKAGPITSGEKVNIPASQFAKKDGTRFNPLLIKPQSLNIDCNRRFGFWKW
jgi:hypothetical protein